MDKGRKKGRVPGKSFPEPSLNERRPAEPLTQLRRQLGWELVAVARTHCKEKSR